MVLRNAFLSLLLAIPSLVKSDVVWRESAAYAQGSYGKGPNQTFISRPDLHAPAINILSHQPGRTAAGYYLLDYMGNAPQMPGPVLLDQEGNIVYASPQYKFAGVTDIAEFRGKPVFVAYDLTGRYIGNMEHGYYQVFDTSYQEIDRVTYRQQGDALAYADIHEFGIVPGTDEYILASYGHPVKADISAAGGHPDSWIWDSGFQLQSFDHQVLLNTTALQIGLQVGDNLYPSQHGLRYTHGGPFDCFHINSVQKDDDGSFLVSYRGTSAVYKVDGSTGKMLWQLGGKRSDFEMDDHARFSFQHHPRWLNDSSTSPRYLSLFDNGATEKTSASEWRVSRGLVLKLDMATMRAEVALELPHPRGKSATAEGSVQQLDNGNFLVGYGAIPEFVEFSPTGEVLFDATFGADDLQDHDIKSYRTLKKEWHATPAAPPDVGFANDGVYASWNGATEHAYWAFAFGDELEALHAPVLTPKTGFESFSPVDQASTYVAAVAVDAQHKCLSVSRVYFTSNASSADVVGSCEFVKDLPRPVKTGQFDFRLGALQEQGLRLYQTQDPYLVWIVLGVGCLVFLAGLLRRSQAGYPSRLPRKVHL